MNAYARARAERAAEEEARADQRLPAWRHRHISTLAVCADSLFSWDRIGEHVHRLREAG